ncbi:hypothetical protein L6452_22939 [Arctium lappa]|uniref:Uncharacterized protein n=1 Tax=Arctium lappa TaxID=4217 RepID=A0ACB9B1J6_ARCLA|nr:hypothetical protein L6452_22939 [Arctium lappa]
MLLQIPLLCLRYQTYLQFKFIHKSKISFSSFFHTLMATNRSPSPLSTRNCRNSEMNSTTRRSFNGNPFARPTALTNPRSLNPPTPANTPAAIDHVKRHSIGRKSVGNSMFLDGKENHKDTIRSPAKGGSKNFMSPTISAASKFTPSPRKKVLGEKNDVLRTSIHFLDKDSDLKSEETAKIDEGSQDSINLEQKEVVLETPPVRQVTFDSSINDATEMLSEVTENSDFVSVVDSGPKIRPFCCSPQTSPIVAPLDHPSLPPYDPKKNFLSPRPQFLRYKPNPRIEILLNKSDGNDDYGDDDVTKLEDSFNLSENSSESEDEQEVEKEVKLKVDSVLGSSEDLSEIVSEEKQSDSMVKKASKKPQVFRRSKTICLLSVMFLIACFSFSFTDSPPMDLPIYKDFSFPEIYQESLKLAASAKDTFDDFVENVKHWSINFISYLSQLKSHFGSTHKITSIQFFNLTTSPLQEELMFSSHIATDYIEFEEEIQDFEEEIQDFEEEIQEFEEEIQEFEDETEMEVDDDIEVPEEVVVQEQNEQIQSDVDGDLVQKSLNLEDGSSEIASIPVTDSETTPETKSETVVDDLEIDSSLPDSVAQSEASASFSINTICLAGFSMAILAASAIFHTIRKKSNATTTTIRGANMRRESCSSETNSYQKVKTSSSNKRESLASSSSDFSMGSPSYGSFTTYERIPIKKGDEVMVTPIRRSSRLMKNQVTCS